MRRSKEQSCLSARISRLYKCFPVFANFDGLAVPRNIYNVSVGTNMLIVHCFFLRLPPFALPLIGCLVEIVSLVAFRLVDA